MKKVLRNKNDLFVLMEYTTKLFLLVTLSFLIPGQINAQTVLVQGTVSVSTTTVQNALVTFIDVSDTTRKYSALTNESGIYQIDIDITSINTEGESIPTKFELSQNYPNPFSSSTSIEYKLNQQSDVQITIYDILGREVRKFSVGEQATGTHNILWNGMNSFGQRLAAGIYFYRLQAGNENQIKKMILFAGAGKSLGYVRSSNFSSLTKKNEVMNTTFMSGNFNVRLENTSNTFPMIETNTIEDLEIQGNQTVNFSVYSMYPIANSDIDLDDVKQLIRGFGGANILRWRPDMTEEEVNSAFGAGEGQIGFSILRLRIPYEGTEAEYSYQVPTAQLAQSLGAIVIASPWTPPPSMKTNNNIVGGELKESSYADYAAHLKGFADYMANNGAPLYAISLQNEPDANVNYESCDWNATQFLNFMKNNAASIGTRIIMPESLNFNHAFSDPTLNDVGACANLSIIGGHIYGGGIAQYPLAVEKGKETWMTEYLINSGSPPANLSIDIGWTGALQTAKSINDCMNANMSAYIWWYIVRYYGPISDGTNGSGNKGDVTKKGYVMSQFARFIRPGFFRVECNTYPQRNIYMSSYKNSSSEVVVVVLNDSSSPIYQTFTILNGNVNNVKPYTTNESKNCVAGNDVSVTNGKFTVLLEPSSITTFVSN